MVRSAAAISSGSLTSATRTSGANVIAVGAGCRIITGMRKMRESGAGPVVEKTSSSTTAWAGDSVRSAVHIRAALSR
jgi:hypothetical protein